MNLPMPRTFLLHFLQKIKPNIMVRLYGSLQFENKETKEKLNYIPQITYENGIRKIKLVNNMKKIISNANNGFVIYNFHII